MTHLSLLLPLIQVNCEVIRAVVDPRGHRVPHVDGEGAGC